MAIRKDVAGKWPLNRQGRSLKIKRQGQKRESRNVLLLTFRLGLGNIRPAGHIRPAKHINMARELHLKFLNIYFGYINTKYQEIACFITKKPLKLVYMGMY
jgi:hypothetical protein